jgi:hypothetical protein
VTDRLYLFRATVQVAPYALRDFELGKLTAEDTRIMGLQYTGIKCIYLDLVESLSYPTII